MRAQASLEYLIILGIALFLLIPVISLFYNTSVSTQTSAEAKEIKLAGTEIVSTAERVFFQGVNTRIKLELQLPGNVKNVSISDGGHSLVFDTEVQGQNTEFVFFSDVPLDLYDCDNSQTAEITTEGTKEVFVKSCGANVSVYVSD